MLNIVLILFQKQLVALKANEAEIFNWVQKCSAVRDIKNTFILFAES